MNGKNVRSTALQG